MTKTKQNYVLIQLATKHRKKAMSAEEAAARNTQLKKAGWNWEWRKE